CPTPLHEQGAARGWGGRGLRRARGRDAFAVPPLTLARGGSPGCEMARLRPRPPHPGTLGVLMRFGIAVFPGTWSDRDCRHAVELAGHEAVMLWHKDRDLQGSDCVILPCFLAYGDHPRSGPFPCFAPFM